MRKSAALFLAVGVTAALSGCAGVGAPGDCTPINQSGAASRLVEVSGTVGVEPRATFPTPVLAEDLQTRVVTAGEGEQLQDGDVADIHGVVYDGRTGQQISTTGFGEQQARVLVAEGDVIGQSLQCQRVGARSVTIIPNEAGETRILVADIMRSFPGKAEGMPQLLEAGFPSVVTAPDGTPGITVPRNTAPPAELMFQELRLGDGAEVEEGDIVVVQFTGIIWETENVFRSTWNPPAGTMEAQAPGLPANVIADERAFGPGFAEALIGQPVDSQVIVVIPPDPENTAGIPAGTTMVIVFDVLGIL